MNKGRVILKGMIAAAIGAAVLVAAAPVGLASNHSDAPLIKQDPQANLTDVYAFIGTQYNNPSIKVLNVSMSFRPFSEPGDGAQYERFADDARYSIHITDPNSGATRLRYDFTFSPVDENYKNKNTVLSYGLGREVGPIVAVGDARQNFTQTFNVVKVSSDGVRPIGSELLTPPPNVGSRVTPAYNDPVTGRAASGATTLSDLDVYTSSTIHTLRSGEVVWAGHRDDSFYSDIPGIFDLLNPRIVKNDLNQGLGQDGDGVDGFKGFNVLAVVMQIPLNKLQALGIPERYDTVFFGKQTGVGVYATASRPRIVIRNFDGTRTNTGGWQQVSRLGNPLFTEGLVAFRDKDRFNRTPAVLDEQFAKYARNPELAKLINQVFGTAFATSDRADLEKIFIPEVLKVVTTTGPVRLAGQDGFSRFGFIDGDTTDGVSGGWPNGRRFGDDVVDIALTAIASGPTYSKITKVGDNVARNDLPFHQVFPYMATPHSGANNSKDSELSADSAP
jgi:hypothetical protein